MTYHNTPNTMAKIKNTCNTNAVEDVKQQELSLTVVEMENGTATLEGCLAVSYKIKHLSELTIQQLHSLVFT